MSNAEVNECPHEDELDKLEAEIAALKAQLAYNQSHVKTLCEEWAETHTHMQELAKTAGATELEAEGDSYGVPGIDELGDLLSSRLARTTAERDAAREAHHQRRSESEDALRSLTPGGSEYQTALECAEYVRRERGDRHESLVVWVKRAHTAESDLEAARADVQATAARVAALTEEADALTADLSTARAEVARLTARVAEVQEYGREYIARTDPALFCSEDLTCGTCRGCLLARADKAEAGK